MNPYIFFNVAPRTFLIWGYLFGGSNFSVGFIAVAMGLVFTPWTLSSYVMIRSFYGQEIPLVGAFIIFVCFAIDVAMTIRDGDK